MEDMEHVSEARCIGFGWRRMGNKMVVIRKHRPSFQLTAKPFDHRQQTAMQNLQALCASKVMLFEMGGCGDEISATLVELMSRCMRPVDFWFWHGIKLYLKTMREKSKDEAIDG